ncbi:hypothetical protein PHLGIDRAFT_193414 [Phlebiopsis gigantea 11061_1 CR5-6]|uniref:Uncharacterized protein n=1 Tax=Phlebiopsis gigantea (strain 11061_1 CR5-6) TaxID=745531 RepID=A0A0C3NHY8_PHLG1|nr:hypothetical protein PHLGIDRAFT_193414 [Phlebiopsis gigantea 11061_1 CR5-6]
MTCMTCRDGKMTRTWTRQWRAPLRLVRGGAHRIRDSDPAPHSTLRIQNMATQLEALTSFAAESAAQLANIPLNTEALFLGLPHWQFRRRPAHSASPDTVTFDGEILADIITNLPNLSHVRAPPVVLRSTVLPVFPSSAPTSVLYVIQQTWPMVQPGIADNVHIGRRQVAIPARRLIDQVSPPPFHPTSEIRVVKVVSVPVGSVTVESFRAHVAPDVFREVVIDIAYSDPAEAASVGCMLGHIGRSVNDLSIRWGNPENMQHVEAEHLSHSLRIECCPGLSALAMSLALVPGLPDAGRKQWAANVHLLESSNATALRHFELCIFVPEIDILDQVKQIRWQLVRHALARFAHLRTVTVVLKGPDEMLCDEVWQEIELRLRALGSMGVVLGRGRFSKL